MDAPDVGVGQRGEGRMGRILKIGFVAVGCLGLTGATAGAQEVIHAMTGTVRSVDAAQKSFLLFRDTGTLITFKDATGAKIHASNDTKIFPSAATARAADKKDDYVIVFYYGMTDDPTAVAVQALGAGPFTATVGTVADYSDRDRSIAVRDDSGTIHHYKINASTVAESDFGVVDGLKFHAEKGGHIRVVGAVTNDDATALFLNAM
jgi:hypothetical protein